MKIKKFNEINETEIYSDDNGNNLTEKEFKSNVEENFTKIMNGMNHINEDYRVFFGATSKESNEMFEVTNKFWNDMKILLEKHIK